ncbi:MAG: threonylcarbamoyl-AMP synthase [Firmicutes bacterium]|nr:threonylcarbamoyl-AMP synthase [Candidatus Caballimonas caccae]
MQTEILKVTDESVEKAVDILLNSGIIGMPTETVYGLAGVGFDSNAVKEIYRVKGRPSDNPLIAHVHKDYDLNRLVKIEQPYVNKLIEKFMPGPLTLVLNSKGMICEEAVCGGDTLAIRMPSHEGCQKLLCAIDMPLVAPSANISKHTSPVTAMHVYNDLNGQIPLILDGGKCSGGIESTVLDVTCAVPRILRAGLVTKEMITEEVGACEIAEHKEGDRVKSPGVKYRHYRPKCDTCLYSESEIEKVIERYNEELKSGRKPYIMCGGWLKNNFKGLNILDLGETDREVASNLYDKLLEGETKADIIIGIAMPNENGIYLGVMNRMKKSCG